MIYSLRKEAEKILTAAFPAARVDPGSKAINISGGSLARPVDVVPSHWHDTTEYQRTGYEYDRGIYILDIKSIEAIQNMPFLHIKRITERDTTASGGLKKAIRLCKNVKSDANEEGKDISLPSFDIAAMMYHADITRLAGSVIYELSVLAETQRFVDVLAINHDYAKTLLVPDGSRAIFDSNAKLIALNKLSTELDDLLEEVGREQVTNVLSPTRADKRSRLFETYIPN